MNSWPSGVLKKAPATWALPFLEMMPELQVEPDESLGEHFSPLDRHFASGSLTIV